MSVNFLTEEEWFSNLKIRVYVLIFPAKRWIEVKLLFLNVFERFQRSTIISIIIDRSRLSTISYPYLNIYKSSKYIKVIKVQFEIKTRESWKSSIRNLIKLY